MFFLTSPTLFCEKNLAFLLGFCSPYLQKLQQIAYTFDSKLMKNLHLHISYHS
jgi:hypothetical protein